MKTEAHMNNISEKELFEVEGGKYYPTAPSLGVFKIVEWLCSLFS